MDDKFCLSPGVQCKSKNTKEYGNIQECFTEVSGNFCLALPLFANFLCLGGIFVSGHP